MYNMNTNNSHPAMKCAGFSLLEIIIASSIFVIFVTGALSAGVAAANQARLNEGSSELMNDAGRLKTFLAEEFSRVPYFEEYLESLSGGDYRKGTEVILYPKPLAPSASADTVEYSPGDDSLKIYGLEYIKLRNHLNIADDPSDLVSYTKDIHRASLSDDPESPLLGTDDNPVSLVNYINANPTPFMIYDPTASGSQWWIRPTWESDTSSIGQTLSENSDPSKLRHYFLMLMPANGSSWVGVDPLSPTPIELGDLIYAYTNPGDTAPRQIGLALARNVDRRSFRIQVNANLFRMNCRMYKIITPGSSHYVSRSISVTVPLPRIPGK